jgi:glycosyltransferase involved in cell wall biosynthesis
VKRRLRIALVHHRDASDVRTWSGTPYFLRRALQQWVGDVIDLGPSPIPLEPARLVRGAVRLVTGRSWSYDHDPLFARMHARVFRRRLADSGADLVFSPGASVAVAFLESSLPLVYYSDATFRVMRDYYVAYTGLTGRTARGGEELEARVLQTARLSLFSSDWASESAIQDYGANPDDVHTVYIGANLHDPPAADTVRERQAGEPLRMLMVGVDWRSKGGDIAVETMVALRELGIATTLTVVGCTPPSGVHAPGLEVVPFLNKRFASEAARLDALWRAADVFLLPTRHEAAGVVFCEAAAYGLPVFATRTGGVPSLVRDGVNGFTLPPEARGREYASRIAELFAAPERYRRMTRDSRDEFEKRLNWDSWGRRVSSLIEQRLAGRCAKAERTTNGN